MGKTLNDDGKISSGGAVQYMSLGNGIANRSNPTAVVGGKNVQIIIPNNGERSNSDVCYYGFSDSSDSALYGTVGPGQSVTLDIDNPAALYLYGSAAGVTAEIVTLKH